jgi:hypothetical protein
MSPSVYIGIDSFPGAPPFSLAALDEDRQLVALSSGPLAEMVAYTSGASEAVVAINAPPRPNQGLALRLQPISLLETQTNVHQTHNLRLAEFELRQNGYNVPRTFSDLDHCHGWMRRGFTFYTQIKNLGYVPFPSEDQRTWLETQADACYQVLLGVAPFRGSTLEGRIQRQLVLRDQHLPVADAMVFFEEITRYKFLRGILPAENIHSPSELNALMAALVAWLAVHAPQRLTPYGDPEEGVIYLPCVETEKSSER